jgi:hypothetical protein
MNPGSSSPVFQFYDTDIIYSQSDLMGIWKSDEQVESVSYDISGSQTDDSQVWRANLPADLNQARSYLTAGIKKLEISRQVLESVPSRLDQLREELDRGRSFGISERLRPEAELLEFLANSEAQATAVSFGLADQFDSKIGDIFSGLLHRLRNSFNKYAWVETSFGERLIARTAVDWSGDFHTAWTIGLDQSEAELHSKTLRLALKTRDVLARMIIMIARATVKISLLLSSPITAPLALPAAYKYVHAIMADPELIAFIKNEEH